MVRSKALPIERGVMARGAEVSMIVNPPMRRLLARLEDRKP